MELGEECKCSGDKRFRRGGDAALVSLRCHVPAMTAIIRREDRTLIEREEKKKKERCARRGVGGKESPRSLIWNVAPCEFHVNQRAAVY